MILKETVSVVGKSFVDVAAMVAVVVVAAAVAVVVVADTLGWSSFRSCVGSRDCCAVRQSRPARRPALRLQRWAPSKLCPAWTGSG